MIPSFVEGLSLAMLAYGVTSQSIRISGIQEQLGEVLLMQKDHTEEIQHIRESIAKQSNYFRKPLESEISEFLENLETPSSNVLNVDTVYDLVNSLGTTLLAITVSGKSTSGMKGTMFKRKIPSFKSTLITTGMDCEAILKSLKKISQMKTIVKATIVTKRLESEKKLRYTSMSILAFLKVLHILGHPEVFLTDKSTSPDSVNLANKKDCNSVYIKFEGTLSFKEYVTLNQKRNNLQFKYLQSNKNNVYILGGNGSGKSTWGNLFIQRNEFEVGDSIHTTLIPESIDITLTDDDEYEEDQESEPKNRSKEIRLWDTPGLFDGSDEQHHMEKHMDKVINQQMYFLCVVFIFNGAHQSNHITIEILDYAIRRFGEKVKSSFIAIVNDKNDNGMYTCESYWDHLNDFKFKVTNDNFFVASVLQDGPKVTQFMRQKMYKQFKPGFVSKHREFFDNLTQKNGGNFNKVLIDVNKRSHEELQNFLDNGKVRIAINDVEGFYYGKPAINKIALRQYETRFFLRKIGVGEKLPIDQKIIFLDESLKWSNPSSINLLNRTTQMEQKRIFLNHIIKNPSTALMTSTSDECDFILFDYSKMDPKTKQEIMQMHILNNKNFGLSNDVEASDASSVMSMF